MHQLQGPKLTIYYCQGISSQEVEGELIQLEAPAKFFYSIIKNFHSHPEHFFMPLDKK
jgi:hypothetical protein